MRKRRNFTPEFKTQVVLELLREEKDLNQIASEHEIAPNMLRNWKKEFLANASNAFSNKKEASFGINFSLSIKLILFPPTILDWRVCFRLLPNL